MAHHSPQRTDLRLDAPTEDDLELVRQWRNDCLFSIRTPYPTTEQRQRRFFADVVAASGTSARYFAIRDTSGALAGYGSLTSISWEDGSAEISLIIAPNERRSGLGRVAADLLLDYAFNTCRLEIIYGEVFECNPLACRFWRRLCDRRSGDWRDLPNRKFWRGKRHHIYYFSINRPNEQEQDVSD